MIPVTLYAVLVVNPIIVTSWLTKRTGPVMKLKRATPLESDTSIITVDIPNQPNAISGKKLKDKFKKFPNVKYAESIEKAIKSVELNQGDLILITGSLYLCSEVLNLN